jgi:hypothetical protein
VIIQIGQKAYFLKNISLTNGFAEHSNPILKINTYIANDELTIHVLQTSQSLRNEKRIALLKDTSHEQPNHQ